QHRSDDSTAYHWPTQAASVVTSIVNSGCRRRRTRIPFRTTTRDLKTPSPTWPRTWIEPASAAVQVAVQSVTRTDGSHEDGSAPFVAFLLPLPVSLRLSPTVGEVSDSALTIEVRADSTSDSAQRGCKPGDVDIVLQGRLRAHCLGHETRIDHY